MILNYNKSRSLVYPEAVDTMTSKSIVYLRRNITEVETEFGTMYEYDEAKLTKTEYKKYIDELTAVNTVESITDLQLAVTEIYEMILGGM